MTTTATLHDNNNNNKKSKTVTECIVILFREFPEERKEGKEAVLRLSAMLEN